MNKRRKISTRKKFLFSLVAVVAFFVAAEGVFRCVEWFQPPRTVDFGMGFNDDSRVFAPADETPGIMRTLSTKRVSFVDQTFERIKPKDTFRIVALGGSSVHYLEPEFQFLESALSAQIPDPYSQVEVINCGGFAYGSHRLVFVCREILTYDPDLILLYTGHNEFEEVEQFQLSGIEKLGFDRAVSKSAIIRFIRDRSTDYQLSQLEEQHNQRVLKNDEPVSDSNYARAWTHPFTEKDVSDRMTYFRHNLNLILDLAKEKDVPVVMGTVSSNLFRPYLPKAQAARYEDVYALWKQSKKDEGIALANSILVETPGRHQASELENEIIRELANQHKFQLVEVPSLIQQSEPHGIPGETLFDDHCHLNQAGRAIWMKGYVPEIMKVITAATN